MLNRGLIMKRNNHQPASAQEGVVLIEALVAILLFSIGVLGVAGLQAAMVKNTSESKFRADAAYLAQQNIGQLWARPDSLPADGTSSVSSTTELPNGTIQVARSGVEYTVTVSWQQTGEAAHSFTTTASINGG